jgi:hypothetical protein
MSIHKGRSVRGFGTKGPSGNVKIKSQHGKIKVFATYRAVGSSCPSDCALLNAGCYAQQGNVNIHQRRAGSETFDPVAWAEGLPLGSLIRWNVSGDVVGADGADYREAIHEAHTRRPDLKGWSYTHAWSDKAIVHWAQGLPDNVRIVASLDDPADVDRARSMGWRTIAQVTETADGKGFTDEEARKVRAESGALPCPAQRVDLGCADCQACGRDGLISFAVHGPGQKKARVSLAARRSLAVVDRDVALTGSERDRYIAERFGA